VVKLKFHKSKRNDVEARTVRSTCGGDAETSFENTKKNRRKNDAESLFLC
jgi:hypothetical protein